MTSRSRRPRSQGAEAGAADGARSAGETRPPQRQKRPRQGQQEVPSDKVGSVTSSGINSIGSNILLNLDVDPGEKDINSVAGVAVCYDTGQMTT